VAPPSESCTGHRHPLAPEPGRPRAEAGRRSSTALTPRRRGPAPRRWIPGFADSYVVQSGVGTGVVEIREATAS
jgi:hypothetical protein